VYKCAISVSGMLFEPCTGKYTIMSEQNKKQFGVWMDSRHATIVGRSNVDTGVFVVMGHVENSGADSNSNEKTAHNAEKGLLHKFFKEITSYMQNAEEVLVTGTGTAQEQFIHYMAETPQFKNTAAKESTSNKLSEEKLLEYISGKFN
jgi:stalled ribosome rescue protein Dom34